MLDKDLILYIMAWFQDGCGSVYMFEGYREGLPLSDRTIEKIYTNTCNKLNIDNQGGLHSLIALPHTCLRMELIYDIFKNF
ncbi:MAG TPA: hypothetical protein VHO70_06990 [Chitinispirillaceae bacterium]|nr:hypothetical protein [Chitinispirillaceae bacterium]